MYTCRTPRQYCTALLENWVNTDNGVKPKTWNKLMEVLSEVDELEEVISEIKQGLISEGVSFDGMYVCVCVCVCMYVCVCVCVCVRVCVHAHAYLHMNVSVVHCKGIFT